MKKKIILLFMLTFISTIVFSILNVSAASSEDFSYNIIDKKVQIIGYNGSESILQIPDKIKGYPVTSIGYCAITNENTITSIFIPDSVINIYSNAFSGCVRLTNVNIGKGVTDIRDNVFSGCTNLTNINVDVNNENYSSDNGILFNKNKSLLIYYPLGITQKHYDIPYSVTHIMNEAFRDCVNLTSITIPNSVKSIGDLAFYDCGKLSTVFYNGNKQEWDKIRIGEKNYSLNAASKKFFFYVSLIDENGKEIFKNKYNEGTSLDIYDIPEKFENITNLYTDKEYTNKFDVATPITENLTIYLRYVANQYLSTFINDDGTVISENLVDYDTEIIPPENPTKSATPKYTYTFAGWDGYNEGMMQENREMVFTARYEATVNKYLAKFVNDDGTVISENLVDYGTEIIPPENPVKYATPKYTYTFAGWDGYKEGMTQENREMVFTAKYDITVNQYTYKFIDENGTVLKEETVDYGTVITPPEVSDKDPYTFDFWENYTEGMTVSEDIEFKAVYKYKAYTIRVKGLEKDFEITYNDTFVLEVPTAESEYIFNGYYTEENGKGTQVTDESGKSIENYKFLENITVYPYFRHELLNKIQIISGNPIEGSENTAVKKVYFATDKNAGYFIANFKYPEYITLKEIASKDFKYVSEDSSEVKDGYVYQSVICQYNDNLDNVPLNKKIAPFELIFDIPENIEAGSVIVEVTADSCLIGDEDYAFDSIINETISVEAIEIIGDETVILENGEVTYKAQVTPDYATYKAVEWSVSDEALADVTRDGILTPKKAGTVTLIAAAKDGSGVIAEKVITIKEYAKINSLKTNTGIWDKEFTPSVREYTVYVNNDADVISFTASFTSGTLKINGSLAINNRPKAVTVSDDETNVILFRSNAEGYEDCEYKVNVVKFEGTKTELSENGDTFTVNPINIKEGSKIILALYNNGRLVEAQTSSYDGNDITFTTNEEYTDTKVMVWNDLLNLKPVCSAETVK